MTRLFPDSAAPRVFAEPLGVDFCAALIDGVMQRLDGQGPEAIARVEIHVANARMQRRLQALFAARGPGLLPRIRPVTALGDLSTLSGLPPAVPPLQLRLQLAQLVDALLVQEPEIAPRAAIYDLADSLADLMAEMFEERVTPQAIAALDLGEHAQHWAVARRFLDIATGFFRPGADLTPEARQAAVIDRLFAGWRQDPPDHPVIVAGSTGSRGATFRLMQAVARLPQGAVVLPGLDRDLPPEIWDRLLSGRRDPGLAGEDHPQYRLARVAEDAGLAPAMIPGWSGARPAAPGRNRAVSLALRPAPVTHQWRTEGPGLPDPRAAFAAVTLLEAPSLHVEAVAIALRLRKAAEDGQRAALVTPDRRLARQVTAALDRWGILPDDSAGEPLDQTVGGRFLRQVAEALAAPVSATALVALLANPICHSGAARGAHLRLARDLELTALRGRVARPGPAVLRAWAEGCTLPGAADWAAWLSAGLFDDPAPARQPFAAWVDRHLARAEALAAGPGTTGSGGLYDGEAGAELARLVASLRAEGGAGGAMGGRDYADFFAALARDREARKALRPRAGILIWGTLEARVQGADLVILGGLNEGSWPAAPGADPWLNRALRADAGLRLPDRVIGLSAHDFQQAIAAPEVWLSRARRDDEADTVPSRWLNRLTNLLAGASDDSRAARDAMGAAGARWIAMAEALLAPEAAVPAAPRPAPVPPAAARPASFSVTEIATLVRDPYAIYARHVLGLRPLDPLDRPADAALRGTAIHDILDRFGAATADGLPPQAGAILMQIADAVLEEAAPWPAVRRIWHARFARAVPWFLETEAARRAEAAPWLREVRGQWQIGGLPGGRVVTLRGKADRIDRLPDGRVAIYDYKTGSLPSAEQERVFNQQLWLEAVMAAEGAFAGAGPVETALIAYIGLGATPEILAHRPDQSDLAAVAQGFRALMAHYLDPDSAFPSRRAVEKTRFAGDYDHLARHGEWEDAQPAERLPVGGGGAGAGR